MNYLNKLQKFHFKKGKKRAQKKKKRKKIISTNVSTYENM